MNGNWEGITHITDTALPLPSPPLLAQNPLDNVASIVGADFATSLLNLGKAILIFVLVWIVAFIAGKVVQGLLKKTEIDNRVASWMGGGTRGEDIPVEKWAGTIVYWLILLFGVVAFLQALSLDAVSRPLNELLAQITVFLPKLGAAALLLGIAWLLATLVKTVITRVLGGFNLDQRLSDGASATDQFSLSETIGNALYWFIFLLFLPSILSTLNLEGTLAPVQTLVNDILSALPNILKALIIGAVGWFVASFVRRVVSNLLAATGVNQLGEKFGLSRAGTGQSLAQIIGTIVYVLILIPVAISALQALQIAAISVPAVAMLNQVLQFLPKLFAAAVIIGFAYFAGKFVAELVSNILTSIGFDNIADWLGLPFLSTPGTSAAEAPRPETGQATVLQSTGPLPAKTPSEIVGTVVLVVITAVGVFSAVDVIQIQALEAVVGIILLIAGQVFLGLVVLAIGLFFANLAFRLIAGSGGRQATILAQTARIAIIALVAAMALQQMGVAPNIVNLAFGLLLGAIAVAIALAFGLGGRDVAGEQVREWLQSFKNR